MLKATPDIPKRGHPATKLLFIGRHGEGVHNIANDKYGEEAWDKEWAHKTGDDEMTWGSDPPLTETGINEARTIGKVWQTGMEAKPPIPFPSTFYCSPMQRPSQTLYYTFMENGLLPEDTTIHVREGLREKLDTRQPQKRRPLSELKKQFPSWQMGEGMTEEDELWSADQMETDEEMAKRAGHVLDEIFGKKENCVSITCHSNLIKGILNYIGHPVFFAPRGAAFAVLLEASLRE